ncbi:hypothetical protein [Mocis latipes granulovirus]|uniref:Uncharacterized protein n=1 Tax=Mocis latipes granulovirus TaxID=2072024 RepID=A0A161CD86_9BBAC|nr:hypothetical protein [Mocis latipes granulovirus]AKR17541.1 hypothetical protein [Mocis latipes granulovirus]
MRITITTPILNTNAYFIRYVGEIKNKLGTFYSLTRCTFAWSIFLLIKKSSFVL